MFYCVEDSDGDIAYHTTDPNDPDLQHHLDKWSYFDPTVKHYDDIWEVRLPEPKNDYTLWSIHADEDQALTKLEVVRNMGHDYQPYLFKP